MTRRPGWIERVALSIQDSSEEGSDYVMGPKKKKAEQTALVLRLVRGVEDATATNGLLTVLPREDLPPPPPPFFTIEKPWLGNVQQLSRIPPKSFYRLLRKRVEEKEVISVISAIARTDPLLGVKGREGEDIAIVPLRDIALVESGSIGIVGAHTGQGTGHGPDPAFADLCAVVFAAIDRGERVLLEIRS